MALEENLAEDGTSSPATSTSQVSQAAPPGALENLKCPICLDTINDQGFVSWHRHPFCFGCMVKWFHRRAVCPIRQLPFPHTFHTVGVSDYEVCSIRECMSSASHAQGEQAGPHSGERLHHSSGCQHHNSYSGSRGGTRGGSRGGSRGTAQERSRSRYPRQHHNGRSRVQQAQGYNHSSSRRRQQSRAQDAAHDKRQAPRTKQHIRAFSRRHERRQQGYQVSFIEPKATRSRSRQRPRSTASKTLREYLRKMERDEGQTLRHEWHIRASSGRSEHLQRGRQVSYREPQVTRSRTLRRSRSTLPLKDNPRRMARSKRQALGTEQGSRASSERSERHQRECRVSFIEPQVPRSRSQWRSRSSWHQTLRENLRRMEHDEGRALRPEQDIPTSSGWSERHQEGRQIPFTELAKWQ